MTNTEFVKRVLEISATNPTYRTGGDGRDGTCDCIGLVMGALGGKFDMHSTNYFARYKLANEPNQMTDEEELELGDTDETKYNHKGLHQQPLSYSTNGGGTREKDSLHGACGLAAAGAHRPCLRRAAGGCAAHPKRQYQRFPV